MSALHSFRFASPTTRRRPTPSENGLIPGLASPASSSGRIAPSVTREWSERDINVWGFQVCSGSFRQQKLTLCVTMKQRWIFHSYRRLRCLSRTTSSSYQELEPFAACRGKHKYRGFAHGVVKPPEPQTPTDRVFSVKEPEFRC